MVCAGLTLWLSGCATSPDPHQGGFISGIVGLVGGGYQRRIDARQEAHQGALDAHQRLKTQAQALEEERAAVRSDLARANARLAAIQQRIAQQRAMLRASNETSVARQTELRRLDQAEAQVKRAQGGLRRIHPDRQPVSDSKSQLAEFNRELDQADSVASAAMGQ